MPAPVDRLDLLVSTARDSIRPDKASRRHMLSETNCDQSPGSRIKIQGESRTAAM